MENFVKFKQNNYPSYGQTVNAIKTVNLSRVTSGAIHCNKRPFKGVPYKTKMKYFADFTRK